MTLLRISTFFAFLLFSVPLAAQQPADAIVGYYLTALEGNVTEHSQIQIIKGTDGKYQGKVVWIGGDDKSALGMAILSGFTYNAAKKEWSGGKVYDPVGKKSYNALLKLQGGKLLLRGYVGKSWMGLGRTTTWQRETQLRKD